MSIYKLAPLLLFQLLYIDVFSQSFVEGVVVDNAGEPIPLVNISIRNKASGTISNSEGKFKLDISKIEGADTIVFSHISYLSARFTLAMLKASQGKINLIENTLTLKEVTINATQNDLYLFEDIINHAKSRLKFSFTYNIYYREWVRENASYNRFADGLLTVTYPLNKENMKVQVDQSRAIKLPKDDDEMFESVNPLKMEFVLDNVYINFLNRFRKEKSNDFNIVSYPGLSLDDFYTIIIEPKNGVTRDNSKLLYKAKLKVDQDQDIKEVEIKSDSLSAPEKSILGLKVKILEGQTNLSFHKINGQNCLAYARMQYKIKFTFKKKVQIDVYTSEFILLGVSGQSVEIPRKDEFKKNALYKNGNKYTTNFWEGLEMPLLSKEEIKILESLAEKSKITTQN